MEDRRRNRAYYDIEKVELYWTQPKDLTPDVYMTLVFNSAPGMWTQRVAVDRVPVHEPPLPGKPLVNPRFKAVARIEETVSLVNLVSCGLGALSEDPTETSFYDVRAIAINETNGWRTLIGWRSSILFTVISPWQTLGHTVNILVTLDRDQSALILKGPTIKNMRYIYAFVGPQVFSFLLDSENHYEWSTEHGVVFDKKLNSPNVTNERLNDEMAVGQGKALSVAYMNQALPMSFLLRAQRIPDVTKVQTPADTSNPLPVILDIDPVVVNEQREPPLPP